MPPKPINYSCIFHYPYPSLEASKLQQTLHDTAMAAYRVHILKLELQIEEDYLRGRVTEIIDPITKNKTAYLLPNIYYRIPLPLRPLAIAYIRHRAKRLYGEPEDKSK